MAKFGNFDGPRITVESFERRRNRQAQLIQDAIVDSVLGKHVHYLGGGTSWCNMDVTCPDARPISELFV